MDGNDDAEDERQCDGGDVRAQPCRCRTAVFVVASFFTFLWQERVQAVVVVVFYVSDRDPGGRGRRASAQPLAVVDALVHHALDVPLQPLGLGLGLGLEP